MQLDDVQLDDVQLDDVQLDDVQLDDVQLHHGDQTDSADQARSGKDLQALIGWLMHFRGDYEPGAIWPSFCERHGHDVAVPPTLDPEAQKLLAELANRQHRRDWYLYPLDELLAAHPESEHVAAARDRLYDADRVFADADAMDQLRQFLHPREMVRVPPRDFRNDPERYPGGHHLPDVPGFGEAYLAYVGASPGDDYADSHEKPGHWVMLHPFLLTDTVTNSVYDRMAPQHGFDRVEYSREEDGPVTMITSFAAEFLARWLSESRVVGGLIRELYPDSEADSVRFELPGELHYEAAARAGQLTRYPWGNDFSTRGSMAVQGYPALSRQGTLAEEEQSGKTFANHFGMRHPAGNVFTWCAGQFDGQRYADQVKSGAKIEGFPEPVVSAGSHPQDPPVGPSWFRCLRGGYYSGHGARVSSRGRDEAGGFFYGAGCRLLLRIGFSSREL